MKNILFIAFMLLSFEAYTQGCVAIRSGAGSCSLQPLTDSDDLNRGGWSLVTGYRYFKSFRHFSGTTEHTERVANGTDVRNWQHSLDLTLAKELGNHWSISFGLPLISNLRSSMYEHYGNSSKSPNARHTTRSSGIGDLRIMASKWLLDPLAHSKGNIQAGLGIKFPTGDYKYQDYFYRNDSTKLLGFVDQSIQPGDGGTGLLVEFNGFYTLNRSLSLYGTFFYLVNPRDHNGVSTGRGATPSAAAMANGSDVMSVPDQFMFRGGINFMKGKNSFSGGLRYEGIPVKDIIGESNGFRRPGRILGIEPGYALHGKKVDWFATAPVWFYRERTQSVPDKIRTQQTGTLAHGDAAFSDYTINAGARIKF